MQDLEKIQARLDWETRCLSEATAEGDIIKIALFSGSVSILGWVLEDDVARDIEQEETR